MAYEKQTWLNRSKATPLNAERLIHIEDGIAEADANATLALESKQDTLIAGENISIVGNVISASNPEITVKSVNGKMGDVVLKTSDLENDSGYITEAALVNKQDKLVSGSNIKTVNNLSLLGSGNIEIQGGESTAKYKEYTDPISLDLITDSGVYKISNATDAPVGTTSDGLLEVKKLLDDEENVKTQQEWLSSTNRAVRVLGASGSLKFYVNDVEQVQGTIVLPAGGIYTLKGDLLGHIEIGATADTPNNRTKIILNGVNIQSADYEAAIAYLPESKKLTVELVQDTDNYLLMSKVEAKGDNDLGALHSNSDLTIQGVGYLTIKNNKGHGIKGSELKINGNTHIYVDANHDAVHGGKLLKITGGSFKIANANDAFSSSEGATNDGVMSILGGEFNILKCNQAAFDGKSANGLKQIMNTKITFGADVTELFTSPNGFKIYTGFNDITNETTKTLPSTTDLESMYSAPSITDEDGNIIDCSPALIELNPVNDIIYIMQGNFTGHKIVINPAANKKVEFTVKNLYYKNTDATDTEPFILHNSNTKRMKLKFTIDNSLTYIFKQAGSAIKTGRSIQLTSKGDSIISCPEGYAIYAKDGYVVLGGDGLRKIENSKFGVYSTSIRLGEDPEDVLDDTKFGISDAVICIDNNSENDVVIANWSDTDPSIKYTKQIIATQYHCGCSVLGKIVNDNAVVGNIIALSGEVRQESPATAFENTALMYVKDTEVIKNENVIEYLEPVGFNETIPELIPSSASSWKVYTIPNNIYTKDEVDAKFVTKEEYTAKILELEAVNAAQQKVINLLEDHSALTIYPTYPKLTYTAAGLNPIVTRGNAAFITNPIWTNGSETISYNKDGLGYINDGDSAQFNIIVDCPAGKALVLKATYEGDQPYKNLASEPYIDETGAVVEGKMRVKATKVTGSFSLEITALASYAVTYKAEGTYIFSDDAKDLPAKIAEGEDLIFKFFQSPDKQDVSPTPTAAEALAKIKKITINNVDLELTTDLINKSGKGKVTVLVPKDKINGNIIVELN